MGGWCELHFDAPDPGKIPRVDLPFSPFTVALEEVTTAGNTNEVPERIGLLENPVPIPYNRGDPSPAEGRRYDRYVNIIQPDILLQQVRCHGFDRRDMVAQPGCAYTKSTDISPDIKNNVIRPKIMYPVFRNFHDLAASEWYVGEPGFITCIPDRYAGTIRRSFYPPPSAYAPQPGSHFFKGGMHVSFPGNQPRRLSAVDLRSAIRSRIDF